MRDSPDGSRGTHSRRRPNGRTDPSRRNAPAGHTPPPARGRHQPTPGPALTRAGSDVWLRDLSPATLTSLVVGLILVVMIGAVSFFAHSRRSAPPPPATGEATPGSPRASDPQEPPVVSYSPGPVSLSTRASLPSRTPSPTHRPTPISRPTSPKPSPSSPRSSPPRPGELTPLPPSEEPNLRSTGGGPETFIDFINTRSEPVIVHWLDYGGQRQQYAVLQPAQSYQQQTYVGHPWVVTNAQGTGLVCFEPADETLRAVIR